MDLIHQVTEAYLQTAEGSEAGRLRFLEGLWEIQSRVEAVDRPYVAPEPDAAREAYVTGQPLFLVSPPEVPLGEYLEAVSQVARHASEMTGLPAPQGSALADADFASAVDAERLAAAVNSPDEFVTQVASQLGAQPEGPLTPAAVAFVLVSALVPFLTTPSSAACRSLGAQDPTALTSGHCPACGASATMGRVGESTKLKGAERVLWCGLCHAEWNYERIRCVRCGTRNPDNLRYTHVEGDSAHRVHLCDECHGYTRFVFVDDLDKPVSMVVEDAVTATLDAVASNGGYTATGDGGKARN